MALLLRLVFFVHMLTSCASLSTATDALSPGQSLFGNQTLVSKEGNFVLGFFSPGKSLKFYVGIWYKKIPKQTVIWVANRENPLPNSSAELKFSNDGHLLLLDHLKTLIWSSNSTRHSSNTSAAVLLDNGNLILRDGANPNTVTWQSFDHPTDTYVPESWIGMNKVTGEYQTLTSWKNSEDPSPGFFSETIDPGGTSEFFLEWNKSERYWRSGLWTGHYFAAVPILPEMKPHTIITITYVDNKDRRYTSSTYRDRSKITRQVMDVSGQIKQWVWSESAQDWALFFTRPSSQCDVYSVCGPFGICHEKSMPVCKCPQGFSPASFKDWELHDWSSGCMRNTKLQCSSNISDAHQDVGFLQLQSMLLPSNAISVNANKMEHCRSACLNACSCAAYAYNSSGCFIWNEEVRSLKQLDQGDDKGDTLYVRLAAADIPSSSDSKRTSIILVCAAAAVGLGAALLILIYLALRYKKARFRHQLEGSLIRFTYAELQHMTKNFSDKLGSGGFGSVFRATLPSSGAAVAVKRLEGVRQGEKQFRTEVCTLGLIQHINLIRLRGFCTEGDNKLLVYDFMQNGSLDSWLCGDLHRALGWKTRYEIVLGIARGLAYLHENCRECIIHCDIKPENILLDESYCAKLADFGMAKLIGRDFSRVLTTMRGTIGYLAPEWISGMPITPKADVFSFGAMLFEIISGKRNKDQADELLFFPAWAANKVSQGEVLAVLDQKLEDDVNMDQLITLCRVACWCIQDNEVARPSMGQVVQVLENVVELNVPPVPGSLQCFVQE